MKIINDFLDSDTKFKKKCLILLPLIMVIISLLISVIQFGVKNISGRAYVKNIPIWENANLSIEQRQVKDIFQTSSESITEEEYKIIYDSFYEIIKDMGRKSSEEEKNSDFKDEPYPNLDIFLESAYIADKDWKGYTVKLSPVFYEFLSRWSKEAEGLPYICEEHALYNKEQHINIVVHGNAILYGTAQNIPSISLPYSESKKLSLNSSLLAINTSRIWRYMYENMRSTNIELENFTSKQKNPYPMPYKFSILKFNELYEREAGDRRYEELNLLENKLITLQWETQKLRNNSLLNAVSLTPLSSPINKYENVAAPIYDYLKGYKVVNDAFPPFKFSVNNSIQRSLLSSVIPYSLKGDKYTPGLWNTLDSYEILGIQYRLKYKYAPDYNDGYNYIASVLLLPTQNILNTDYTMTSVQYRAEKQNLFSFSAYQYCYKNNLFQKYSDTFEAGTGVYIRSKIDSMEDYEAFLFSLDSRNNSENKSAIELLYEINAAKKAFPNYNNWLSNSKIQYRYNNYEDTHSYFWEIYHPQDLGMDVTFEELYEKPELWDTYMGHATKRHLDELED